MPTPSLRLTVQYKIRHPEPVGEFTTILFDITAIIVRLQPPVNDVIVFTYPVTRTLILEQDDDNHRIYEFGGVPGQWRDRRHPLFYLFPQHDIGLMYFPDEFKGQIPTNALIGFSTSYIATNG